MLIGELAHACGTTPRALRYYEERGLLTPTRSTAGYRLYADDAVVTVHKIKALLDAGFDSTTVGSLLPCTRPNSHEIELCPRVEAAMRRTLARIEDELHDAAIRRGAVRTLLGS